MIISCSIGETLTQLFLHCHNGLERHQFRHERWNRLERHQFRQEVGQ